MLEAADDISWAPAARAARHASKNPAASTTWDEALNERTVAAVAAAADATLESSAAAARAADAEVAELAWAISWPWADDWEISGRTLSTQAWLSRSAPGWGDRAWIDASTSRTRTVKTRVTTTQRCEPPRRLDDRGTIAIRPQRYK